MSALKTAACRHCGQPIAWVRTDRCHRMPVDPEPNEAGNVFVSMRHNGPHGSVSSKDRPRPPGVAFMPHFSTCVVLNKGRKTKPPKPAPPPPPPDLGLDL